MTTIDKSLKEQRKDLDFFFGYIRCYWIVCLSCVERFADNLLIGNDFYVGMLHKVIDKDVSNNISIVNGDILP